MHGRTGKEILFPRLRNSSAVHTRACDVPRQRTLYNRSTFPLPDDLPQRLERFKKESGLSWSEIARRLGTYRNTVWRWKEGRARPNYQHRRALLALADSLGHLFTG